MSNEKANTPILTQIYRTISGIFFLLAAISFFGGLSEGLSFAGILTTTGILLIASMFSLGIAEVIHLIAKIEFNTRENSQDYQSMKLLSKIAKNTEKDLKEIM